MKIECALWILAFAPSIWGVICLFVEHQRAGKQSSQFRKGASLKVSVHKDGNRPGAIQEKESCKKTIQIFTSK